MPSAVDYIDVDIIPEIHPVQQFYQFWQHLPKQQDVATWDDKLIMVVPEIVSWMCIVSVDEDKRYMCRFCGAAYEQMIGRHHQGMYLDEALPKEAVPGRLKELADIAEGNGPLFSTATLPFKDRETISVYRGVFGFSKRPGEIDRFVLVIAPKQV